MMGGSIDWAALSFVCEILGVDDVEVLLYDLISIRDKDRE
jgi:hypothetical protein